MSQRYLGRELHRLDNGIRRYLEKHSELRDEKDLSGVNGSIIRYLSMNEERDIYQKDVEKAFGITRSTASRVLTLMEEKNLIRRQSVERDGRLRKLVLTERSQKMSRQMRKLGEKTDRQLLKGFSPMEEKQLYLFLDRMLLNLEEDL